MSFGGKNMKRPREKGGKCGRKGKKGERKRKKGERKLEKRKQKGKLMQNREELRQKGHDGSRKTTCHERGKKHNFQKGGGNKYRFWTEI
jgi:hypothetical protein